MPPLFADTEQKNSLSYNDFSRLSLSFPELPEKQQFHEQYLSLSCLAVFRSRRLGGALEISCYFIDKKTLKRF